MLCCLLQPAVRMVTVAHRPLTQRCASCGAGAGTPTASCCSPRQGPRSTKGRWRSWERCWVAWTRRTSGPSREAPRDRRQASLSRVGHNWDVAGGEEGGGGCGFGWVGRLGTQNRGWLLFSCLLVQHALAPATAPNKSSINSRFHDDADVQSRGTCGRGATTLGATWAFPALGPLSEWQPSCPSPRQLGPRSSTHSWDVQAPTGRRSPSGATCGY